MALITRRGYSKTTNGNSTSNTNGAIVTSGSGSDVKFEVFPDAFWTNGSGNLDLVLPDGQQVSFTVTASNYVPIRAAVLRGTSNCGTVIAMIAL
jgi:hypothetical protein